MGKSCGGHVSWNWAANKRFEILKFKFKFPRARTYELIRARSRLYRCQILQVDTRWKALAEIYTLHAFAPFSYLILFSFKIAECFADFLHNFAKFTRILLNFVKIRPASFFATQLNNARVG